MSKQTLTFFEKIKKSNNDKQINHPMSTFIYPKISIVTPSYNQGQFIEQTIKSILDQNYPNLEYIIIDGGSTDETVEIIKRYEDKISFWVSEKDNGQSDAINKGIEKCTGDIFNWINSDDYLQPNSLFVIAEEYTKQPFTALCGQVQVIDNTTFSHIRKSSNLSVSSENAIANFNINQEGTWWSLKTIKELKGVNEAFHYTMDLDLWIRALSTYSFDSFRRTDVVLSNFRRHENAKSTLNSNIPFTDDQFRKEELVIFNQFIPGRIPSFNYFDLFSIEKLNYTIDLSYSVPEVYKQKVTELYLFKLLSYFFYNQQYELAKKCISSLEKIGITQNKKDINYFQKKIFVEKLKFWK